MWITNKLLIWSLGWVLIEAYRPRYNYYDYYYYASPFEKEEVDPLFYTSPLPEMVNGSRILIPSRFDTPDYRIPESHYLRYHWKSTYEEDRPFRISPFYKQQSYWYSNESPKNLGCTCTTVFKRYTLLATCAVLTNRHVLTTATSTELILKRRKHFIHFENVLGVWYDNFENMYNSSMYATPARIHYHPRYLRPSLTNRSHPFPVLYDLSLWTMTHRLYGGFWSTAFSGKAVTCERGSSGRLYKDTPTPTPNLLVIIVGYQFMKGMNRKASPFVKYAVRTRRHVLPCPKTNWGWFHCVATTWAKLGLDSGANMHRTFKGSSWMYDGLLGINAISMKLRTIDMVHYFINLDSHLVLDFLYNSYMGVIPYEWLDYRFEDTQWWTLECKDPNSLYWNWEMGEEKLYYFDLPNY